MYRPKDAIDGLFGLIGWRKHYNPSGVFLAASMLESRTGQCYQDFHPLLTLDNIEAVAPQFEATNHAAWNSLKAYAVGDVVSVASATYQCLRAGTGQNPTTAAAYWELTNEFSIWLKEKTRAAIGNAIRKVWAEKLSDSTLKNTLEQKYLFDGTGRMADVIPNEGKLVGFELVPIRANGVTVKIEKVGIQTNGQGPMTVYLMHSSSKVPVATYEFNKIRIGTIEWFNVGEYLPYVSDATDAGGSWYLVYKQAELANGMQAISKDRDWSKKPCSSCSAYDSSSYTAWSRYLEVHPFCVSGFNAEPDFNNDFNNDFAGPGLELWDVEDNQYTYSTNYGLNLQVAIECDPTDLIIANARTFQNLIGLQFASDMLLEMAYNANARINRRQQLASQQEILYALDGDSQGYKKSGIAHSLALELKGLSLDMTNMSRLCFTCNKKGVKFMTV